jgi:hypothetical protein
MTRRRRGKSGNRGGNRGHRERQAERRARAFTWHKSKDPCKDWRLGWYFYSGPNPDLRNLPPEDRRFFFQIHRAIDGRYDKLRRAYLLGERPPWYVLDAEYSSFLARLAKNAAMTPHEVVTEHALLLALNSDESLFPVTARFFEECESTWGDVRLDEHLAASCLDRLGIPHTRAQDAIRTLKNLVQAFEQEDAAENATESLSATTAGATGVSRPHFGLPVARTLHTADARPDLYAQAEAGPADEERERRNAFLKKSRGQRFLEGWNRGGNGVNRDWWKSRSRFLDVGSEYTMPSRIAEAVSYGTSRAIPVETVRELLNANGCPWSDFRADSFQIHWLISKPGYGFIEAVDLWIQQNESARALLSRPYHRFGRQ